MNGSHFQKRSRGREFALKALYLRDIYDNIDDDQLEALVKTAGIGRMPNYGRELIDGCIENIQWLDEIIQKVATNWRLDRMPNIDRNILRIGAYELMCSSEVPPKVAINEAIELSKRYSTEDSPNFINGVLDKVYTEFVRNRDDDPGEDCEAEAHRADVHRSSLNPQFAPDPLLRIDMHMHSDASDGAFPPEHVVKEAKSRGLDAIALSDHDSVDGLDAALEAGREHQVLVVPGVEMSAYTHGPGGAVEYELHILGYFIDYHNSLLVRELQRLRSVRLKRVRKIAEGLSQCGINIDIERIIEERYSSVGRLHVALELIEMGVCRDVAEAFDQYLGTGQPAYVPKSKLGAASTIELIHAAGGAAVLAHPGLNEGVEKIMPELTQAGLDGLEVHYPGHNRKDEAYWLDVAKKNGLCVTGGSDYHGNAAADVELGQETVSYVELYELLERARRIRSVSAK